MQKQKNRESTKFENQQNTINTKYNKHKIQKSKIQKNQNKQSNKQTKI